MIKPELLAILCCPETRQPLTVAGVEIIASLNRKIAAGELKNRAGEKIEKPIQDGLVRQDGKYIYFVRNEIPVMLIDQAVSLI